MEAHTSEDSVALGPPLKIMVRDDHRSLEVSWSNGTTHCLDATALRRHCRSSDALRARLDGTEAVIPDDISITDARLVGTYALNIVFSDGEYRGIYPWSYLREIASKEGLREGK